MKFYKDAKFYHYLDRIIIKKLNCIYINYVYQVIFYKNGIKHNIKNMAYTYRNRYKEFFLNGISYGDNTNFTKKSWRRFVKMQVFK
jgi:hypothetical protein